MGVTDSWGKHIYIHGVPIHIVCFCALFFVAVLISKAVIMSPRTAFENVYVSVFPIKSNHCYTWCVLPCGTNPLLGVAKSLHLVFLAIFPDIEPKPLYLKQNISQRTIKYAEIGMYTVIK